MSKTTETLPTLLDQKQVAAYLGKSTKTLEKMRLDGSDLPYAKIGRSVRYKAVDVLDYVERNTVNFTSETAA